VHARGGVRIVSRHPWALDDTRDERSFRTDFANAIANAQFDRACKLFVSRYTGQSSMHLVRHPSDPRGWITLEASAAVLMRRYPRVQQALARKDVLRGRLRVRQAIADKDPVRVARAAAQFYGTAAAAEAHVWLGDRAYVAGGFRRAAGHYAAAAKSADVIARADVAARQRLAAAHLGRTAGRPAVKPVTIGSKTLSPQKIEQEVARALQAAKRAGGGPARGVLPWVLPGPARFASSVVANPGQMPRRPAGVPAALWTPQSVGRLAALRPCAVPFAGGVRCERVGSDLVCPGADGVKWQTKVPGLKMVRQPRSRGGWIKMPAPFAEQPRRPFIVSEPVVIGDRVYALFDEQTDAGGGARISLHGFNAAEGKRVLDQPLFALPQFCSGTQRMLLKIVGGRCLVWFAGGVLCAEIDGPVAWARLPEGVTLRPAAGKGRAPSANPFVVDGKRVILGDAGAPYVECVDLPRGIRRWASVPMDVVRLAGHAAGRLLVETADEIVALDPADGRVVWRRPASPMPNTLTADKAGTVLYARRAGKGIELVWLDAKTGKVRAAAPVDNLAMPAGAKTRLGPFLGVGRELLAPMQTGGKAQVVRLMPRGSAAAPNPDADCLRRWRSCVGAGGS